VITAFFRQATGLSAPYDRITTENGRAIAPPSTALFSTNWQNGSELFFALCRMNRVQESPGFGDSLKNIIIVGFVGNFLYQLDIADDTLAIDHEDAPGKQTQFLDQYAVGQSE